MIALPCGPLAQGARVEVRRRTLLSPDGRRHEYVVIVPKISYSQSLERWELPNSPEM
jgi:hypothetical protein